MKCSTMLDINQIRFAMRLVAVWMAECVSTRVAFMSKGTETRTICIRHGKDIVPVLGDIVSRMSDKAVLLKTCCFYRNGTIMHGDEPLHDKDVISVKEGNIAVGENVITIKTWPLGKYLWGPESARHCHPGVGAEGKITRVDIGRNEASLQYRRAFSSLDSVRYSVRMPLDDVKNYVKVLVRSFETIPFSMKPLHGHGSLAQMVRQMRIEEDEEDILSEAYKQQVQINGMRAMQERSRRSDIARDANRIKKEAYSVYQALNKNVHMEIIVLDVSP